MADLIDRQAAIDALGEEPLVWHDGEDELAEREKWRRDVQTIRELPSAQLERKTGHWIEHNPHKWGLGIKYECSECGHEVDCEEPNFCPDCGADMRGENHENTKMANQAEMQRP